MLPIVCYDLGFVNDYMSLDDKKVAYENYFGNKEFKKIVTSFKKKRIDIMWGTEGFSSMSEIKLVVDKIKNKKH